MIEFLHSVCLLILEIKYYYRRITYVFKINSI